MTIALEPEDDRLSEAVIDTAEGHIHIIRLPEDPICMRASIGGDDGHFYCSYRGDPVQVKAMLEQVLAALIQTLGS